MRPVEAAPADMQPDAIARNVAGIELSAIKEMAMRAAGVEDVASLTWGVPSFRVDANPARWGQDRLWQVERDLIAATGATPVQRSPE